MSSRAAGVDPEYYYSTQPFLAWILNHYFYGKRHFCYVAAPFHPYRLRNPTSSSPWKQFGAQYEPWVDRDPYDAHVIQKRINIRRGVAAQTWIPADARLFLHAICENLDQAFLLPIVYRVNLALVDPSRRSVAGSGGVGSNEVLLRDLRESEFDVLFFDPVSDPSFADVDLAKLGSTLWGRPETMTLVNVIDVLIRRCST